MPSVRFSLAVHSYGRSWGSSTADTERRVRARVGSPRAHARA